MTSLQHLRDTLDAHAAVVHDDLGHTRSAAVRGRASAVRRRRAGVVCAAALMVAAVITATVLPAGRTPVPAERMLIGQEAPATMESLGYTYHFVRGVESEEKPASVRLRASDRPRLITWASDADRVRVVSWEEPSTSSDATEFNDFVLVSPGETGRWQVRAGGADSAIAVYELGDELPPGVTLRGLHFRDRVGDETLLDSRVGAVGQAEVTLEMVVPDGMVRVAEFCTGVPDDYTVNVELNGQARTFSSGCADDTFDPGGTSDYVSYHPGELGQPGITARIRVWVSKRDDGPAVTVDSAQLALAAYLPSPPAATVAGRDVPEVLERDGHLWGYVESLQTAPGADRLTLERTLNQPILADVHAQGLRANTARVSVGRGVDSYGSYGGGVSGMTVVLDPGDIRLPIVVQGGLTDETQLGVSLYERAD